jgi:Tol biopolymer transport system component
LRSTPASWSLEARRVWSGVSPNFYASSPSPDGRYLSEIDWSTGDLAVRNLETGRLERVTDTGGWDKSGDYAQYSVFSDDGRQLAYTWWNQKDRRYDVRTINRDGSGMRVLLPGRADLSYAAVEDWSPDGKQILVTAFRLDRNVQIALLDAVTGAYRALKTTDWRFPTVSSFSPDGRFIAYDLPENKSSSRRDIMLVSVDGRSEAMLVGGNADHLFLGWLPDSSGILYYRRTPTSRAIWKLAVRDGRAVGKPDLVRDDVWHISPLGFSRDKYFYGQRAETPAIHLLPVDLRAGRVLGKPQRMGDSAEGIGRHVSWSPDSRQIAYIADQGSSVRGSEVVIRSASGELQRALTLGLSNSSNTAWTPDGSAILIYGQDENGDAGIHRIDLASGRTNLLIKRLPGPANGGMGPFAVAPDGRIYYRHFTTVGSVRVPAIMTFDPKTQATTHFVDTKELGTGQMMVSPDGRWLGALAQIPTNKPGVMLFPTAGGEPRTLVPSSFGVSGNRSFLGWSPDSKTVVFNMMLARDSVATAGVYRLSIDGGEPVRLIEARHLSERPSNPPDTDWRARDLRVSPDGRYLAYQTGRDLREVWQLSGFGLSPASAVKGKSR